MFIDTHCHLFKEYYDNIDKIIKKCKESKVSKIIVSGCDYNSNKEVLELVNKYDIIYGTIGFHPTELNDFNDNYFEFLEDNINNKKIVGIGEIGLDYHYDDTDKDKQLYVLERQLKIAEKYNKPIIFHSRDSINDTYNILKNYNLKGSIHCFSGSLEMANKFIILGYKLGVGGVVTFKNSKVIKKVVENVDLNNILLETDAPYLTPEPYRGLKNDSSYLIYIANKISEIKHTTLEDVARVTTSNALDLFDFSNN